ncbi:MAG: hypothetical protein ISS71_06630 [Phycisphaerae bacterium]|nr:hypothetical protein [Phycisphaerae bacterium]
MDNDTNNCSGCNQKDRCGRAFEKLGKAEGPNIVWKVIAAFLTPIVVFILSLVAADKLLRDRFESKMLTIVGFLAALAVTLTVLFLIRAIRRPSKNRTL